MDTIEVKVLYFGMIAEQTDLSEEFVALPKNETKDHLLTVLHNRYPSLKENSYIVAIDEQIVTENKKLNDKNVIALLPPFSGG